MLELLQHDKRYMEPGIIAEYIHTAEWRALLEHHMHHCQKQANLKTID